MASCYYDNREDMLSEFPKQECDTTAVAYSVDIVPILENNCYTCHSTSSASAGLDLTKYDNVKTVIDNGKLLDRISRPAGTSGAMPPIGSLNKCSIDKIKAWADRNAPDN